MSHQIAEGMQNGNGRADVVSFPLSRRARASSLPLVHESADAEVVTLWGTCPSTPELSDYDRRNISLYARLLHDESEGAGEDDLARVVFGLDPYRNRGRVLAVLRSHMRRAHWIADTLFPMLDW